MATTSTDSIALHLQLSRALAYAQRRQWTEAERVLSDRAVPEHPLTLEALAAVVTSEGDYERALRLWERLLQFDPNHIQARRMIAAIELWLTRPSWAGYVPYGLGAAVIGILVMVFSIFFSEPQLPQKKNGHLPAGVNAPLVATDPGNPVYAAPVQPTPAVVAPTPVPPINFSLPNSSPRHRGH